MRAAAWRHPRGGVTARQALKVAAAATGVGLLTGFFGVGGGFVIVPALVLALGFEMPAAVGTSLLVIAAFTGLLVAVAVYSLCRSLPALM